ncbi:MAG: histidine triad nucleotide-binding protein [Clostridiales bacterium]|nr:histidine triad nucleotide-binding protein [Clostridiales bacterium]
MMDCLFCKIINGEIPSDKVYENDKVYAFRDIAPQAPIHVVIVPKTHIASANDITADNSSAVADIYEAIPEIAKSLGISESGYRIVNNCGKDAGQTVFHIHFHLLGGETGGKMY